MLTPRYGSFRYGLLANYFLSDITCSLAWLLIRAMEITDCVKNKLNKRKSTSTAYFSLQFQISTAFGDNFRYLSKITIFLHHSHS